MKSYQKGYRFERKVKKFLEEKGYFVIRQGKSSFPDLIAIKNKKVIFVECKINKYLSKKEKIKAEEIKEKTKYPFIVFYESNRKIKCYGV